MQSIMTTATTEPTKSPDGEPDPKSAEAREAEEKRKAGADAFIENLLQSRPQNSSLRLSKAQIEAIRKTCRRFNQRSRHLIDLRFTVPLYFTKLYVVFLLGRDRRKGIRDVILDRRRRARKKFRTALVGGLVWVGINAEADHRRDLAFLVAPSSGALSERLHLRSRRHEREALVSGQRVERPLALRVLPLDLRDKLPAVRRLDHVDHEAVVGRRNYSKRFSLGCQA